MSPDFRVMVDPSSAYDALAVQPPEAGAWTAVRRPLLVALVVGAATALAATGRLTAGLALSGAVCWSFVPAVQMGIAASVLRSPRTRLRAAQRLDLWFMGHAPWSLWMLGAAAFIAWFGGAGLPMIGSAIVPIVWTAWIARAFCLRILQDTPRQARRRLVLQQALTWMVVLAYVALAAQLWPRLLAELGR